jgi:hypothetical protein
MNRLLTTHLSPDFVAEALISHRLRSIFARLASDWEAAPLLKRAD